MAFIVPFLFLAYAVHECCHILAALALGVRPIGLNFGFGRAKSPWSRFQVTTVPVALFYRLEFGDDVPTWKRAVITLAGSAGAWTLSFLLLLGVLWGSLIPGQPIVERVHAGSPAERAGMVAGDRLVRFGGTPTPTFEALREAVMSHRGGEVSLDLERAGGPTTLLAEVAAGGPLGIIPVKSELRGLSAVAVAARSTVTVPVATIRTTAQSVVRVLMGGEVVPVDGPILRYGIAPTGPAPYLWFFVEMCAVALLFFTLLPLLPVPGFDAFRLLSEFRRMPPGR